MPIINLLIGLLPTHTCCIAADYYAVARDVEPLRKRVSDMERQQAVSERELSRINASLATLTAEIADLDTRYRSAAAELSELKEKAGTMERRLSAASRLIAGLGSERARWGTDVERLGGQLTRLLGDALLAAGFLTYLGPFTYEFRVALLQDDWQVSSRGGVSFSSLNRYEYIYVYRTTLIITRYCVTLLLCIMYFTTQSYSYRTIININAHTTSLRRSTSNRGGFPSPPHSLSRRS